MATTTKEENPAIQNLSLKDDDAWEQDEGIPRMDEPMLQKYFQGRDALIVQEDKHRSDFDFRELLSPLAREACSLVDQIRFEEQQTLWTAQEEDLLSVRNGGIYPGMMFSLAKEKMEQSRLWKIIRKMPKGALLHCHLEAMIDLDWLFEQAFQTDGICFASPQPLSSSEALESAMVYFQYHKSTADPSANVWDESYIPGTFVPIDAAAKGFPDGGKPAFIKWLKSRSSITNSESISHHHGPNAIWVKFQSCFTILKTLIYYEPIYRKFLAQLFKELMEDGVQWVDVRAAFAFEYRRIGREDADPNFDGLFQAFGEEIKNFQATKEGQTFWGARMIWTSIRAFDNKKIFDSMNLCIDTKLEFPDLIAGFDLVGHEDPGRPLAEMTPLLFWFRKACAEAQVTIPFFFHAGETLGTGTETDHNLFDAIALGTRRIGHGFSLYKHPLLISMVRDRRILIECCPISNEVLRLTSSIMSHPFPALLAQGVPVSLSNDDPAILGQNAAGMSHDFWQALQGIESLGLAGLGSLAENSVRWATYEDLDQKAWTEEIRAGAYGTGTRAKRMRQWKSSWEKFCQDIVLEYGADIDLEEGG